MRNRQYKHTCAHECINTQTSKRQRHVSQGRKPAPRGPARVLPSPGRSPGLGTCCPPAVGRAQCSPPGFAASAISHHCQVESSQDPTNAAAPAECPAPQGQRRPRSRRPAARPQPTQRNPAAAGNGFTKCLSSFQAKSSRLRGLPRGCEP